MCFIIRDRTPSRFPYLGHHLQMSAMSKELSAWHGIYGNEFCVHDSSAISTITEQIHQRISETMNAKRMAWKGGNLPVPAIAFRGEAGQVRSTEYVPGEIRSRIRTVVHLSAVDHPPPRVPCKSFALRCPAALRDARHFSTRFNLRKMPAAAMRADPFVRICFTYRYSILVRMICPRVLRCHFF